MDPGRGSARQAIMSIISVILTKSKMFRSSQPQHFLVENIFLLLINCYGTFLNMDLHESKKFLFEEFRRQDFLDPEYSDKCIWVQYPSIDPKHQTDIFNKILLWLGRTAHMFTTTLIFPNSYLIVKFHFPTLVLL